MFGFCDEEFDFDGKSYKKSEITDFQLSYCRPSYSYEELDNYVHCCIFGENNNISVNPECIK